MERVAGIAAVTLRLRPGLVPLLLALAGAPALAEEAGLAGLETRWHDCVRQAFGGQPLGMERRAAQRAALAACKPQEDAYVHAMLAAQEEAGTGARDPRRRRPGAGLGDRGGGLGAGRPRRGDGPSALVNRGAPVPLTPGKPGDPP